MTDARASGSGEPGFTAAGLRETEWIDEAAVSTSGRRTFTAVYARC